MPEFLRTILEYCNANPLLSSFLAAFAAYVGVEKWPVIKPYLAKLPIIGTKVATATEVDGMIKESDIPDEIRLRSFYYLEMLHSVAEFEGNDKAVDTINRLYSELFTFIPSPEKPEGVKSNAA